MYLITTQSAVYVGWVSTESVTHQSIKDGAVLSQLTHPTYILLNSHQASFPSHWQLASENLRHSECVNEQQQLAVLQEFPLFD